jgi:cytochrome P450
MAKYPEIQTKAQEEIDRVVGDSRLPSMLDQPNLPYVNAVISEVLRCGPIVPMGLAHKLRVDDVFNGYFLPKDSILFANIW